MIEIRVEAFDWNCQQYITPRYTEEQVVQLLGPTRQRLVELEQENSSLRAELAACISGKEIIRAAVSRNKESVVLA